MSIPVSANEYGPKYQLMTILEINIKNSKEKYLFEAKYNSRDCHFESSDGIELEKLVLSRDNKLEKAKLNILEKLYLTPENVQFYENRLIFNIKSAKNLEFDMTLAGPNKGETFPCKLVAKLNDFNNEKEGPQKMTSLNLNLENFLLVPKLQKIEVEDGKQQGRPIEAWELDGHLPFYEVNLGMALNMHSNMRPRERRTFNRGEPVMEPIPVFLIRYGPFFINKDGAGAVVLPFENFALLATFLLEGEPYESPGIRTRKRSVYFGPLLKIGALEILYYKEILRKHEGDVFKLTFAPEFRPKHYWELTPRVYYQFWSKDYVHYYFGVNQEEARTTGRTYSGIDSFNYGFLVQNVFHYERWKLIIAPGIKFYGKEVYNSPIVRKKSEFQLIIGGMYNLF